MPIASIEINANPVTAWENYHRTLYPRLVGSSDGFFDYDRGKEAEGGYGRCRFKFPGGRPELEEFFELGLGRDIKVFNDRGGYDYCGMILAMRMNTEFHIVRKSLQHVFNSAWARYDATEGASPTQRSNVWNNLESQARFGEIQRVIGGGQQSDLSSIDQAVQNRLDWFAWPMIDPDFDAGVPGAYIEVIAAGWQYTLAWMAYNQIVETGDANLSTVAIDVLTCTPDVTPFIASYDIKTNVIQVPREYDVDRTPLDVLVSLAGMGDSAGNRNLLRVEAERHLTLGPAARRV